MTVVLMHEVEFVLHLF